ncbi:hypothetical protein SERLA73DRAFT_181843 [Serpula lacrymans var. lacrymans S7.3]|uniref:DUF6534 domain-containing protein n=2 Tax=Serpula lacrymans var. lacrymans TaxID=341189 RepID=F8PYU0_SERL3|nr:uncharacterized protein SERLADRAFT_468227 [Serpula lacrymans var. lacrymans S7.9]EGN99053.1 hypothetical protein SERLA73DRAFT_181843 [Serpula lacrymans var. lacrymans S7.3]EGO24628.1 hypothetical protein SERLADRAFT_468227 [Serpula lacrymans var. lacrymans S7.9]
MLYYHLITNFANPLALSIIVWSFKMQYIITVVIIFFVHWCVFIEYLNKARQALRDTSLYAHRLWILGKGRNHILFLVQVVVIVLGSGLSTFLCYVICQCRLYSDLWMVRWEPISALALLATNDVFVAASMWYLLVLSRTGFLKTDTIIKRLVIYVCASGSLTSIFSLASIITCAVMPDNSINLAVGLLLSKLYVNSFIALLNSRSHAKCFGDANMSTLGAVPHPVKCQDDEED